MSRNINKFQLMMHNSGFDHYYDIFVSNGLDEVDALESLSRKELIQLGVSRHDTKDVMSLLHEYCDEYNDDLSNAKKNRGSVNAKVKVKVNIPNKDISYPSSKLYHASRSINPYTRTKETAQELKERLKLSDRFYQCLVSINMLWRADVLCQNGCSNVEKLMSLETEDFIKMKIPSQNIQVKLQRLRIAKWLIKYHLDIINMSKYVTTIQDRFDSFNVLGDCQVQDLCKLGIDKNDAILIIQQARSYKSSNYFCHVNSIRRIIPEQEKKLEEDIFEDHENQNSNKLKSKSRIEISLFCELCGNNDCVGLCQELNVNGQDGEQKECDQSNNPINQIRLNNGHIENLNNKNSEKSKQISSPPSNITQNRWIEGNNYENNTIDKLYNEPTFVKQIQSQLPPEYWNLTTEHDKRIAFNNQQRLISQNHANYLESINFFMEQKLKEKMAMRRLEHELAQKNKKN